MVNGKRCPRSPGFHPAVQAAAAAEITLVLTGAHRSGERRCSAHLAQREQGVRSLAGLVIEASEDKIGEGHLRFQREVIRARECAESSRLSDWIKRSIRFGDIIPTRPAWLRVGAPLGPCKLPSHPQAGQLPPIVLETRDLAEDLILDSIFVGGPLLVACEISFRDYFKPGRRLRYQVVIDAGAAIHVLHDHFTQASQRLLSSGGRGRLDATARPNKMASGGHTVT